MEELLRIAQVPNRSDKTSDDAGLHLFLIPRLHAFLSDRGAGADVLSTIAIVGLDGSKILKQLLLFLRHSS